MADEVKPQGTANTPSPTGNGTGNTPQAQPPAQQPTAQPQEPAWFSAVPEQHREEAKKGWMMQSEFTKKTQEIAERQKQWDQEKADLQRRVDEYNKFAESYTPFYQRLQANWDQIGPILEGKTPQRPTDTQRQPGSAEQFDPRALEVLERNQWDNIGQYYAQQYFNPELQRLKQEFNQAMAQREQYYSNYLNILTDAFERSRKDPNLNLHEFMQKANSIQYGRENPLELAYNVVTSERSRKQLEEEAYNRGKQDAELAARNAVQPTGAMQNASIPYFKQKPMSREQVSESARQVAVNKGLSW
jgi:hypothetical protein